jgi:hypothetical protein
MESKPIYRPAGQASSFEVGSFQNIQQRRDWTDSDLGMFLHFSSVSDSTVLKISAPLVGPVDQSSFFAIQNPVHQISQKPLKTAAGMIPP